MEHRSRGEVVGLVEGESINSLALDWAMSSTLVPKRRTVAKRKVREDFSRAYSSLKEASCSVHLAKIRGENSVTLY